MGVINNLIEIRRKFRAIVGANWDGRTIEDINKMYPKVVILPISDTSATSVNVVTNIYGSRASLYRIEGDTEITVNTLSYNSFNNFSVGLTGVTATSDCFIRVWAAGSSPDSYTQSNTFTVTRTAAQTASLKAGSKSKGADIFTESEADSIDVVKENIEKE